MQLLTLGLNHRTAPIDVRERVSFSREELRLGLMSLGEYDGLRGNSSPLPRCLQP